MRYVALVACSVAAVLCMASPAYAEASPPNIGEIVDTLQESSVYIAEGTEGTNSDTAAVLEGQMREDDQIVIVMLPSDAEITTEEIQQITTQIADGVGESVIVGVSIGDTFDAAATSLPAGVADELMRNADTVSQSPLDTMGTFIRNVHDWERLHPGQVVKTEPEAVAVPGGPDLTLPVGGVTALVLSSVITAALIVRKRRRMTHSKVKYTAPPVLNEWVKQFVRLSESKELKGSTMATLLVDVSRHTEAYFTRLSPSNRRDQAQLDAFTGNFERVRNIVDTYLQTKREPQYAPSDPREILQKCEATVRDFAEHIQENVRNKNREDMLDFEVNVKIISAQRPTRYN